MRVQPFLLINPKLRIFQTSEPLNFSFRKIIFYWSINSLRDVGDNQKINLLGSHLFGIFKYCRNLTKKILQKSKKTWDLFLLETREIFLTFFSLFYHFLLMNKRMQLCHQCAMVISHLGEILIRIPTKRACLKNQTYGKWNVLCLINKRPRSSVYQHFLSLDNLID